MEALTDVGLILKDTSITIARYNILIEKEARFVADIKRRLAHVEGADTPLFQGAPA